MGKAEMFPNFCGKLKHAIIDEKGAVVDYAHLEDELNTVYPGPWLANKLGALNIKQIAKDEEKHKEVLEKIWHIVCVS